MELLVKRGKSTKYSLPYGGAAWEGNWNTFPIQGRGQENKNLQRRRKPGGGTDG